MGLSQSRDHRVALDVASRSTKNYRSLYAKGGGTLGTGVFSREAFEAILKQPGVEGIRYYGAADPDGTVTIILVGTDAKGNDLHQGIIIDTHWPCPPFCSSANPLNS
jgi:hypothetical protein